MYDDDHDEPTRLRRLGRRARARVAPLAPAMRMAVGVAAVAAVAGAVVIGHEGAAHQSAGVPDGAGADQTVRDFLTQGVVDQDGYLACQYLTGREQERIARLVPSSGSCRLALTAAEPGIGGVSSLRGVKALKLRTVVRGDRAWITATGQATPPLRFALRRTTPGEYVPFEAPSAAWRITSGVRELLIPPAAAATPTSTSTRV